MTRLVLFIFILCSFSAYSQDENSLALSDSLFARGVELYRLERYQEALPLFLESDRIDKIALDPTSNRRSYSTMWLASCYYHMGDTATAQTLYPSYYFCSPIDRRLTVESDSLISIGVEYCHNYQYSDAFEIISKAAELEKHFLGEDSFEYACTVGFLSTVASASGNYEEGIRLGTIAMTLRKKNLGTLHPDYAISLTELANNYSLLGSYNESIQLLTEALGIQEIAPGKESWDYATTLTDLSSLYVRIGKYPEALRYETEALEIKKLLYDNDHSDISALFVATSLNNLAVSNSHLNNYSEAIRLLSECLRLREQISGKHSPEYVSSLRTLSSITAELGNYSEAINIATEALTLQKELFGTEHPNYALSLNNLAHCNALEGNYSEAIRIGNLALEHYSVCYGKEHPDYALSLQNLASYYSAIGDFHHASKLGSEAMRIRKKFISNDHYDYIVTLNNLGYYQNQLGDTASAIRSFTECLQSIESAYGRTNALFATVLNNLAVDEIQKGNYSEALRLETEVLEIRSQLLGETHPLVAATILNLASIHYYLNNYSTALQLNITATDILQKNIRREHPDYITSLADQSILLYYLNNKEELEKKSDETTYLLSNFIRKTFSGLSKNERNSFWTKSKAWYEVNINTIAYKFPSESLFGNGYDATLLGKGLLLDSEREFSQLIMESGDRETVEIFDELRITRRMLDRLYEKPIAERNLDTDSLEKLAQRLEHDLIDRSKVYGDYTRNMGITWKDVQQQLKPKELAIEFVSFPIASDSLIYAAYVIAPAMKAPDMITLFEAKDLSGIKASTYYKTKDISSMVWGKLHRYLSEAETVYFAPTGELYNIAIESVPAYDGSDGLISDQHKIFRLSSTRELALIKDKNMLKEATLYGGLKYDTDSQVLQDDAQRYPMSHREEVVFFNLTDFPNMRAGATELPATKTEVEKIACSMKRTKIQSYLFTGLDGTEGSFKNLSGKGVNILHIATHGFYWTETEAGRLSNLNFLRTQDDNLPQYTEDKVLTRSGLLLTGANNALVGKSLPENINDGILTAKEIAALDLRGLDLVVLSACQTGLGEITGEGVFGLQRGFKKAGANTLMMSLWKVDDHATQMLMTNFYDNLFSGKSKRESLMLAQKSLREYEESETQHYDDSEMTASQKRREKRQNGEAPANAHPKKKVCPYDDPRYWAAFILLDALD